MRIFGVTGTLGAGKGTIAEYLEQHKNFNHYSARKLIGEEILRRGETIDRDSLTRVANELRAQHGGDYIFRTLLEKAKKSKKDAVIESIRTVDEMKALEKAGGISFAVDADQWLRYQRISERKSPTDRVSFEKFKADELRESKSANPAEQNLILCQRLTKEDFRFTNNGDLESLYRQIDRALAISAPSLRSFPLG